MTVPGVFRAGLLTLTCDSASDTLASSDMQSCTGTKQLIQRRMDCGEWIEGKTNRFIQRGAIFGESYFVGDQMDETIASKDTPSSRKRASELTNWNMLYSISYSSCASISLALLVLLLASSSSLLSMPVYRRQPQLWQQQN